jgi:glucose-1-phosphate thymidylyltransferase
MKAIILAAGFCTRLFPQTEYFPKALLPIDSKAILSYVLDDLVELKNINDIALVTNHRYIEIFRVWLASQYPKLKFKLINNQVTSPDSRLGAIGDLHFSLKQLGWQDDLLILASDTLTSLKLKNFIAFFQHHRGVVNAIFDTHDPAIISKKLGCVTLDGIKISRFAEKPEVPETTLTSVPYYIYPKEALRLISDYIAAGENTDAPGSIISWFIGKIPCFAYKTNGGYYYDVGTIEIFNRLAKDGVK